MKKIMYDYFYQIEDKHWWFQARKDIVMELIKKYYKPGANPRVLDIGCGTGMMLKYLSKYGKTWGIDKDLKAIEYAQKKAPKAKIILGSLPEKLPKGKFDLVTLLDVIEHVDKDQEALWTIANILKPQGVLVITVPAYHFLWTGHDDINLHKRRYAIGELKTKINNAGFKIRKISYYNNFLFLPIATAKLIKRFLKPNKSTSHFSANVPPYFFNQSLKIIFSFEKYFLPYLNFPFGISLIVVASKK